jgi:hypothetical protein
MNKPYQLHILSYDWVDPFGIDYFDTLAEAEAQLAEYRNRLKVKQWRIYKTELLQTSTTSTVTKDE